MTKGNISVILAHPDLERKSFNHAIAHTAVKTLEQNGYNIFYHDLYAEKFDPVITHAEIPENAPLEGDIAKHCAEIAQADGIIVIHPNWWGQPPAILKGWIDRVLRVGVAYRFLDGDKGEGVPVGLLKAKNAIIFNTCNTPQKREMELFGDPLETIWNNCILQFCGIPNVYRCMFGIIIISSAEQRKKWLLEAEETINKTFPAY